MVLIVLTGEAALPKKIKKKLKHLCAATELPIVFVRQSYVNHPCARILVDVGVRFDHPGIVDCQRGP